MLKLYGGANDNNYFIQDYDSRMWFLIQEGSELGQFYGYKTDGVYTTDDFTQNTDGTYTLKDGVPSLKGANRKNIKPGDKLQRDRPTRTATLYGVLTTVRLSDMLILTSLVV